MSGVDAKPEVRARHIKDWLARIDGEPDPWRSRFFELLPAATRDAIDSSATGGWLPMAMHVELADLMLVAYGPARAHEHYRRSFAASLRSGIFGGLVRAGTRLFGTTPATFLRWAHKGWDASFRNSGHLQGEILGPVSGRLVYSDLPAVCTASDAWLDSSQGSVYGSLDVLRTEGVVRIDKSRRAEGRLEIRLEWTPRK
ncbi:MAG: hypothetical protein ACRELB_14100 [Polyangiaceae bacterium]